MTTHDQIRKDAERVLGYSPLKRKGYTVTLARHIKELLEALDDLNTAWQAAQVTKDQDIVALKSENTKLREALEFYAARVGYADRGNVARSALNAALEKGGSGE